MIQKHIDKLEQEIKDNLEMIELLDSKRAGHVKNSSEYQAYLNSNEWQETRQRIFKRDNFRCVKCGESKNLHVHHITYENLGEEKDADLVTLCDKCHKSTHELDIHDHLVYALSCAKTPTERLAVQKAMSDISCQTANNNPEDIIYLFAYAISMGADYAKIDADIQIAALDELFEFGDVSKVIKNCLTGIYNSKVHSDCVSVLYLKTLKEMLEKRLDSLFITRQKLNNDEAILMLDRKLRNIGTLIDKCNKAKAEILGEI